MKKFKFLNKIPIIKATEERSEDHTRSSSDLLKKIEVIDGALTLTLAALILILPLFFLPFALDFFGFNKQLLFIIIVSFLWLLQTGKMVLLKKVRFWRTPLDLPLLFLIFSSILSTIFASNKITSLLNLFPFISPILLYFVITNHIRSKQQLLSLLSALLSSGFILGLISLILFFTPNFTLPINLSVLNFPLSIDNSLWSPIGSKINLVLFLLSLLPLAIIPLFFFLKKRKFFLLSVYSLVFLLLISSFAIVSYQLLTSSRPLLLPQKVGWDISAQILSSDFKMAVLGSGPNSYLSDFNRFKPSYLNLTPLWNLRFSSSSNFYFQLLAEIGLLGFLSYLFLVIRFLQFKKFNFWQAETGLFLSGILNFGLLIFFPANFIFLFNQFLILALLAVALRISGDHKFKSLTLSFSTLNESLLKKSEVLPWFLFSSTAVLLILVLFFAGRFWRAEFLFKKSLLASSKGTILDAYNFQKKAIQLNPWSTEYRISLTQTDLSLANSLAQKDKNDSLSLQDQQLIVNFIKEAVEEAKIATTLSPNEVGSWENLARIYRSLITSAQGADQFAFNSYEKALALDPTNPNLKIEQGGILYAREQYDEAAKIFVQAVYLKPNLPNAHYNLGHALEKKGSIKEALDEYKIVQSLVKKNSKDEKLIAQKISELENRFISKTEEKSMIKNSSKEDQELQLASPSAQLIFPPLSSSNSATAPTP
ncbi:tetratricopeptide repeat protein [Candidatus Microgenomates bacterium]|nr:tetratricopeptide repeat protein [Candidatus Microgenomates bacterium]